VQVAVDVAVGALVGSAVKVGVGAIGVLFEPPQAARPLIINTHAQAPRAAPHPPCFIFMISWACRSKYGSVGCRLVMLPALFSERRANRCIG
jgi:hypothetical protein